MQSSEAQNQICVLDLFTQINECKSDKLCNDFVKIFEKIQGYLLNKPEKAGLSSRDFYANENR